MTVLTVPTNVDHEYGYDVLNRCTGYTTPLSHAYQYSFDKKRRLIKIEYPSGREFDYVYENGRLIGTEALEGNTSISYLAGNRVSSITR